VSKTKAAKAQTETESTPQAKAAKENSKPKRRLPRGRVTIFPNWCKGCGLCVEFCPTKVLEQGEDGKVTIAHPEKCTACQWCELHCPDFAIFVVKIESEKEAK